MNKVKRNEKCYCGSQLKYKKCCISKKNYRDVPIDLDESPCIMDSFNMNMNMNKKDYVEADKYLKRRYAEYFGIDPNDRSPVLLTQIQIIEKYAKTLFFLTKERANINLKENLGPESIALSFIIASARADILKTIETKFSEDIQEKIIALAESLFDEENC